MRSVILSLLVVQLLLSGAYSDGEERMKKPMCVNPRAKVGASILSGCSQATCKKDGKGKAVWQECEQLAMAKTVQDLKRKIEENHEDLERKIEENHKEILEILGQPNCCPTMQTTTWAPASTTIEGCPSGWSLYESSCYRFYTGSLSWDRSQEECQKENSNLASVTNVGIKTLIGGLQKNTDAWIGGSRPAGSNPNVGWEWLDKTAWSYQNWQAGEPNRADQLCLQQYGSLFHTNTFDDAWCSKGVGGYICEKQLFSA